MASPESVCTNYTFADDSQDEEMVRAADLTDEKISGDAREDHKKETSV